MMKDRILADVHSPPLKGFSGFAFAEARLAEDLVIVGAKVFAKAVPWGVAFTVHLTCGFTRGLAQISTNS